MGTSSVCRSGHYLEGVQGRVKSPMFFLPINFSILALLPAQSLLFLNKFLRNSHVKLNKFL